MSTFKKKNTTQIRNMLQTILVVAAIVCAVPTNAHREMDIVSGAGWEASVDEINWFPAFAPYPNPFTTPNPNLNGGPVSDAGSGTTNAQLMWFVAPNTIPDSRSGPETVYFKYEFDLQPSTILGEGLSGAWVAADDWMRLSVNGNEVGTYLLTDHLDSRGQPIPVFIRFDQYLNNILTGPTDHNTILIEAHDGGLAPSDRLYEWAFFDAQYNLFNQPSFVSEPAPAALLIIGLVLLGLRWQQTFQANTLEEGSKPQITKI